MCKYNTSYCPERARLNKMIKLLERQEVLNLNKTFATFIADKYDDLYHPYPFKGELRKALMDWNATSTMRLLYQKKFQEYLAWRDDINKEKIDLIDYGVGFIPGSFDQKKGFDSTKKVEGTLRFILEITKLFNISSWFFLKISKAFSWINQDETSHEAQEAVKYFKQLGMREDFNGGIEVSGKDIEEMLFHVLWLSEMSNHDSADYSNALMMCENGQFVISILFATTYCSFFNEKEYNEIITEVKKLDYVKF